MTLRSWTGCGILDRPGFTNQEHLAEVKRMLAVPGALEATLGYYRAMLTGQGGPGPGAGAAGGGPPIVVPTLALCGAEDKRAEVMQDQARHFAARTGSNSCPAAATSCSASSRRRSRSSSWTGSPGNRRYRHAELMVTG